MGTLVVNGHGDEFKVTSKTSKRGTSSFVILTADGAKKVEVDEDEEVNIAFKD